MRRGTGGPLIAAATAVAFMLLSGSAWAVPIAPAGLSTLPDYSGSPATANPLPARSLKPEKNPFMAPNPNSNIHNDTWMTDAYDRPGPLGRSPVTSSSMMSPAVCGSLTFDSRGRIVTVCPSIQFAPQARIIDPDTLEILGSYTLPNAPSPPGTREYQNFAGGGYFFIDAEDRVWVATKTDHLYVLKVEGNEFTLQRDYDLTGVLDTANERISSALPDFDGNIWFATRRNGKVGILDPESGDVQIMQLDEEIQNSFAVASDGVYIVSQERMYRFKASKSGKPRVVWSKKYANSGVVKPGQADAGSGTTPTILKSDYVAITDNAEPRMNVVVYRRAKKLGKGERRTVCRVPVFENGESATDNSLIGVGHSLVVENNYGYQDPFGAESGSLTEPGFARIDINKNGKGCKLAWTNNQVRSPTVVPKMSTATGLIYTYSKPADGVTEGYFWTAIDYRTGETAWMKYAGAGLLFNNNYAGIAIGPNGALYLGVIGGLITLRDG